VRICLALTAIAFLLTGCQMQRSALKPSLEDQGEVYLYLRPFPQEADKLKFKLTQLSAIKDDGGEYPLSLAFSDFSREEVKRQRFLATGQLPPGNYVALAVGVGGATLLGEEGEERLLIPEKPVRLECRFTVTKKKATFVSLAFNYDRSVTNGFSFTPVFSITVPGKPVTGLVGYVSNTADNTLTIFDKQYCEVVGIIATGRSPMGMAFDQQRRIAYIALAGEDAVEVIDLNLGEIISRIRLHSADSPRELALTPDGKTLLTVNSGSNTVSVVDPLAYLELTRIQVGNDPTSILMDPTGSKAYVFNNFSQNISVIDVASRSVATTAPAEPGSARGQFGTNGDIIYIIFDMSPYLRLMSPFPSLALQQRYLVGMGMQSIKLDTHTNLLYTGRRYGGGVEIYEPTTLIRIETIRTGGSIIYMNIDNEMNNLFAVNREKKSVQAINLVSREVIAEFDVGSEPYWVDMMGER